MKALFLTLMMSPLAFAQGTSSFPKPTEGPQLDKEFNSSTVRPEKVAAFRAKAAELYRRSLALDEESNRAYSEAEKKRKAFNKVIRETTPIGEFREEASGPQPWISRYHLQRREELQRDQAAFAKEVGVEKALKRAKDAELAAVKAELEAANTPTPPDQGAGSAGIAPPQPVAKAAPSSVPGWPAGVEPAKKKQTALPPGMTKGK